MLPARNVTACAPGQLNVNISDTFGNQFGENREIVRNSCIHPGPRADLIRSRRRPGEPMTL
jgi:hypothetical protein